MLEHSRDPKGILQIWLSLTDSTPIEAYFVLLLRLVWVA